MAIPSFRKSLKLRLPRRIRSKSNTSSPPPESSISKGEEATTRKVVAKEDEFRLVFQFLDRNSDGRISVEELRSYFTSIGESMSLEDVEKIIKECSNGGDMLLGYGEFVRMMELRDDVEDEVKVLRQAFEVYEEEKGSGRITPKGLQEVLRRLGDVKSDEECEAIIRVFDLDGNGVLDFHEFQMMMTT